MKRSQGRNESVRSDRMFDILKCKEIFEVVQNNSQKMIEKLPRNQLSQVRFGEIQKWIDVRLLARLINDEIL